MNFKTLRHIPVLLILFATSPFACQRQDYRVEVTPGQQGPAEVRRVPFTPEERAARDRELKVRAALAQKQEVAADPDLTTLESLWPKLSTTDRAAILERVKQASGQPK
jgi:hypothetical protein